MNILVTGACGYKGSVLVPKLLKKGYQVVAIDTQWFGNFLEPNSNLKILKQDINKTEKINLNNIDTIIHLASIANDPTGDLNPKLTWETSCLSTMRLIDRCAREGVKRFIYASSGSVYGVKKEKNVTEDLALVPISEYNKTKMISERVLLSYKDNVNVQIIRPATVCGLSPRMRLDVSVNLLTMAALENKVITVFGGKQIRPNIHIDDITDIYLYFLENPKFQGIYNAGFENLSIQQIAEIISKKLNVPIKYTSSDDIRSYRVDSTKLLKTGYKPKFSVEDAIDQIIIAYKNNKIQNDPRYHNLKWMIQNNLAKA
jgi:nucleoside-diphosphate-sugar epimerase